MVIRDFDGPFSAVEDGILLYVDMLSILAMAALSRGTLPLSGNREIPCSVLRLSEFSEERIPHVLASVSLGY